MDFLIFIFLLLVAATSGTIVEKRHYRKIKEREISTFKFPAVNFGKNYTGANKQIEKVEMVTGCVVIGADHFKAFVSSIHALFGGKLTTYESVLDRGRREAILRMKEQAAGADMIINTRLETSTLSNIYNKDNAPKVAVIAYGTAITYAK